MNPEHEALLADSVGLALLVVLEALAPSSAAPRPPRGSSPAGPGGGYGGGGSDALVVLLDPDIEVRSDGGPLQPGRLVRGAAAVAGGAIYAALFAGTARPALVNGTPGVVATAQGRPISVLAFTVTEGRIVSIAILNDPERLARLDLTVLDD